MESELNKIQVKRKMSIKNVLAKAIIEYLYITSPIGLYVAFEAYNHKDWSYLLLSPEWGIASVFLIFISVTKFISSARATDKDIDETKINVYVFGRMAAILISSIITFRSVTEDNIYFTITRISLFLTFSVLAILLFAVTELNKLEK